MQLHSRSLRPISVHLSVDLSVKARQELGQEGPREGAVMFSSTTTAVSSGDVRRMLELVAEVSRSRGTVLSRLAGVLRGIRELTGAKVCVVARVRRRAYGSVRIESIVDTGWAHPDHRLAAMAPPMASCFSDEPLELAFEKVLSVPSKQGCLTFRRRDLIADGDWYGSYSFQSVRQAAHIDDCIYSIYPLPETGHYACLALHRPLGAPTQFSDRDRLVVDFVWQSLGFLHVQPMHVAPPPRDLPPDLTPVLEVLRSPGSLRGAERKLGMSPSVFRRKCSAVYRYFGATSRTSLLLRWVSTPG